MSRDWETCSTNHDNGVEDKAIHGRQYAIAEMKLEQPQSNQVSGDKSQSEWLGLRQPDFGDLLATVRIARKREFRTEF